MAFDPDEYLNETGTTSSTATAEFDPDAYLSETEEQEAPFDPDAYLSEVRPPSVGGLTVPPAPEAPKPRPIVETIGQLEGIKNAAMNAFDSSRQAMAVAGGVSPEEAEQISQLEYQKEARKVSPAYSEYLQAEGMDAVKAFAKNPFEITTNIITEGLAGSLYSLGAGVAAGGVAAAATAATGVGAPLAPAAFLGGQIGGTFAGSLATEYGGKVLEELQNAGMDIKDPESIQKFFSDEKLMEGAKSQALKRGVPVAIFDGVSAGIGGRLARLPVQALTKTPTRLAVTEGVAQAALGGGGEIAGAVAAGEEIQPKAVFAEVIGEAGPAAAEITVGRIAERLAKTPEQKQFDQNVLATQVATRASQDVAPATADAVERQVQDTLASTAETPDERVARLQREAQEVAGEIELEEEGAGLPPVEPTPPVTPTPEAAVAPVEPVVPEGGARPATPEIEAIEGESELRKFVRENAETIEDFELVDITRGEGDAAAKELASSLISERAKQRLKTRIDEGKTALLTQTPEGDIFANSSNDESFNVKLDLLPEERRALSAANADREFAETTEEVANANAAIQEAVRPAVDRAVSVPTEGAVEPAVTEVAPTRNLADLEVRPPTDNVQQVAAANDLTVGRADVNIPAQELESTVNLSDPKERERVDNLKEQISSEGGFISRVIVDGQNNVVEGQHRVQAMKELGYDQIPAVQLKSAEDFIPDSNALDKVMQDAGLTASDNRTQMRQLIAEIISDEKGDVTQLREYEAPAGFEAAWNAATEEVIRQNAAPEAAPAAVEPTSVAPPPVTPQLEPLRRVARAEQTEEDVAGLVDGGLVELYKGQPVITQAGLEALPEAERPRLTPEARKIQIDTRTSEAAAEAISKNLRIGVDQVPVDVRMPAGWTLVGDVYVPPKPMAKIESFDVEALAEVDEDSDVFADVIKRKDEAKTAVAQKPEGSAFATQDEFRAAFDLRGEGHGRFATRLDLMVADGVITSDGRDLIMAVVYDNNTDDAFLNNIEMGSMRARATRSYGLGGVSRQTVQSAKGKAIGYKPLLKMMQNARRDLQIDEKTAQTLSTFWHEFGHAGYYSLLDKAQKSVVASAYRKTTKAQRIKFFESGVAAARQEDVTAQYYAKSETEWFAQSFAEYVLTQKSEQKALVPIFETILNKIRGVFGKLFSRKEGTPELNDIFEYIIQGKGYGSTKIWWNGLQLSLAPAVYGTRGAQPIDPGFSRRLVEREKQNRARAKRSIAPQPEARESRRAIVTPQQDRDYLDAVERGDLDAASRMVDEAAQSAGYTIDAYHGGTGLVGDAFDKAMRGANTGSPSSLKGFFFASNKRLSDWYATTSTGEAQFKELTEAYDKKSKNMRDLKSQMIEILRGKVEQNPNPDIAKLIIDGAAKWDDADSRAVVDSVFGAIPAIQELRARYDDLANTDTFKLQEIMEASFREPERLMDLLENRGTTDKFKLSFKNPLIVDHRGKRGGASYTELIEQAEAAGNDGVIIRNTEDPLPSDIFIALEPEQIKSADAITRDNQGNIIPPSQRFQQGEADIRYARGQAGVGMTTDAVRARLEALGFGVEGMIRVVEDPQAAFEGRTIIQDGKAVRIELNASALNDDAAIDRVLNHEFAEAANADGALNRLVERLTPKEKKEINDAITRLGYEERVRTTEEAARAIEALAAGWKGRGFFERAVARVEAWGSKLGLKLTRRAAEYIAARNLSDVNAGFKAAYNRFINVRGEAREGRAFVTPEENARFMELAKDPEANREELQKMVDDAAERAGYQVLPLFHGTEANVINQFRKKLTGIWFAFKKEDASPSSGERARAIINAYADLGSNPVTLTQEQVKEWQRSGKPKDWIRIFREKNKATSIIVGDYATVVFQPSQVKSADPVTYDKNGNIIPLEERFQQASKDIRYSRTEIRESRREPAPTFTEESPEAKTLSNLKASMEKVDAASEAKGGKPETQKVSEIAANWMESGGDERALQDAIVENTNLTPANAARVAKAIAKQYDKQQQIAEAVLETEAGVTLDGLPEGMEIPKDVDPKNKRTVLQRVIDATTGVRVKPVILQVPEKTALKEQIRLKARETREAKKAQQETADAVVEAIKALELRGPMRAKQAQALAKRAAKVLWTSEKSMENFIAYAERVMANTNYDADLREAKAAQKRAKELSKRDSIAAPQRETLEAIGNIGINLLNDPREFADVVNHYLRSFKPVVSEAYVVVPDAEMKSYLSAAEDVVNDAKAEFEIEDNERLADKYGITIDELKKYMDAEEIMDALVKYAKREVIEGILNEKSSGVKEALKGVDTTILRADQRKLIDSMKVIDVKSLDAAEKQAYIRIGNNIIFNNNQTNGAEFFVATAKGQQSARDLAKNTEAMTKNKAWSNIVPALGSRRAKKVLKAWAEDLQSVADTFRNAFGKEAMTVFYEAMGMVDLDLGFTNAARTLEEIQSKMEKFYKKLDKKYKGAATNQDGILSEGIVGYLIQNVPEKGEADSLAQRRGLLQQDIIERRKSGDEDRMQMADRIQELMQKLDGETIDQILDNLKREYPANYESLMWLKDDLFPQYKDFLKQFDENFNDQANNYNTPNYLPIVYSNISPSIDLLQGKKKYYDSLSSAPKQSSYTIKRSDYTQLPLGDDGRKPKEIGLNLRRNAYNSLSDQITRAYTNPARQRIYSFLKTPESEEALGGAANRDFFAERIERLMESRERRGSFNKNAFEKAVDVLANLGRDIGTRIALAGSYQLIRQPADQVTVAIGVTGRADLMAKHLDPRQIKAARPVIDLFSIGRRGDASSGYKYINQMEGAQSRLERYYTEGNWVKAKEAAKNFADKFMAPLKVSDFTVAAATWMTFYRAYLAKNGIRFTTWEDAANLIKSDDVGHKRAAAYAENMTDIYQGSSDPTKMAVFAQKGKTGPENLLKAILVPFNSFGVQFRSRISSELTEIFTRSGDWKGKAVAVKDLGATIGGTIMFGLAKRFVLPAITLGGVKILYSIFGVDVEEPDEEKQKEEFELKWRQLQGDIVSTMIVGGGGQMLESYTIDGMNYLKYMIDSANGSEDVLDDNGEVMSFNKYAKERAPFYRYRSFDNAMSLGILDIGMDQAKKAILNTKMVMTPDDMERFTPEEQRFLYAALASDWLYLGGFNDADFARMWDKGRRDMINARKEEEKALKKIREGR